MPTILDRRQMLAVGGASLSASLVASSTSNALTTLPVLDAQQKMPEFGYCLNTSTIRIFDGKGGTPRPITEQITIAARAGYNAIEPWIGDLRSYKESGGNMNDLRKQIQDSGLTVESSIGFATWIVDDDSERAKGLENARRDMELVLKIGGKRIAAPPAGATNQENLNLFAAAERYRKLLEIGVEIGVLPELELWGFSKSLSRLGELMFVAVESGHSEACVLPDVYHIYKGGSEFGGLSLINGASVHCFHMNDYPANPKRDAIGDSDRVFPGDGIAPLGEILKMLHSSGSKCILSLELFNPEYWKQDPHKIAQTGIEKMKTAVARAFS